MGQEFAVVGMSCGGCARSVQRAVERVEGVTRVAVDLESGRLEVEGEVAPEAVVAAVRCAGFEIA